MSSASSSIDGKSKVFSEHRVFNARNAQITMSVIALLGLIASGCLLGETFGDLGFIVKSATVIGTTVVSGSALALLYCMRPKTFPPDMAKTETQPDAEEESTEQPSGKSSAVRRPIASDSATALLTQPRPDSGKGAASPLATVTGAFSGAPVEELASSPAPPSSTGSGLETSSPNAEEESTEQPSGKPSAVRPIEARPIASGSATALLTQPSPDSGKGAASPLATVTGAFSGAPVEELVSSPAPPSSTGSGLETSSTIALKAANGSSDESAFPDAGSESPPISPAGSFSPAESSTDRSKTSPLASSSDAIGESLVSSPASNARSKISRGKETADLLRQSPPSTQGFTPPLASHSAPSPMAAMAAPPQDTVTPELLAELYRLSQIGTPGEEANSSVALPVVHVNRKSSGRFARKVEASPAPGLPPAKSKGTPPPLTVDTALANGGTHPSLFSFSLPDQFRPLTASQSGLPPVAPTKSAPSNRSQVNVDTQLRPFPMSVSQPSPSAASRGKSRRGSFTVKGVSSLLLSSAVPPSPDSIPSPKALGPVAMTEPAAPPPMPSTPPPPLPPLPRSASTGSLGNKPLASLGKV